MKIRKGFVSNSSSSSFVCWGVEKDDIELGDIAFLSKFNERLHDMEYRKESNDEWYKNYFEKYQKIQYEEMIKIQTDDEKIAYAKENLESDSEDYEMNGFQCGGSENDIVGLSPTWIEKNLPDLKFGEIRKVVADRLNSTFGSNFSDNDIEYYEEGWYDG